MSTLARAADDGDKRSNAPLPHGHTPPKRFILQLGQFNRTALGRSILTALFDHALIFVAPLVAIALRNLHPAAIVLYVAASFLVVSRALRGLECLTHEASHYNLSRSHRLNDWVGNLLAAIPTFQLVGQFRENHGPGHHQQFGTSYDPDLRRYDGLDLHSIDRSNAWSFTRDIARRLPRYIGGWFRNTGADARTMLVGLLWHVVFYIAPLWLLVGVGRAVALWVVFLVVPFLTVLPTIRLIGEAAEHVYIGATSVFTATVSNTGFIHRLLIHPHGDGYHLLHHLWPSVPHHRLKDADHALAELDPDGFGAARRRHSLLEKPAAPGTHSEGDRV